MKKIPSIYYYTYMLMLMLISWGASAFSFTANEAIPRVGSHAKDAEVIERLQQLHARYARLKVGSVANYIPELAKVKPDYFGIVIATVDGKVYAYGDVDIPFAIESVSKPFVYGLALADNGEKALQGKLGSNATGKEFNSITALVEMPNHLQNPLVNAGAIQVTSAIKGATSKQKWERVLNYMNDLGDGKAFVDDKVYHSEMATNNQNRAIIQLLQSYHLMFGTAEDALNRYTKACSIMVTARQLALMGATLANTGVNPLTKRQVMPAETVLPVLSQMVTNGLYENSGYWWQTVGLPAKSGVGGGIVAVVPHQFAIVVFSPRLDQAGNSVRGQAVIRDLSVAWHLHLLS